MSAAKDTSHLGVAAGVGLRLVAFGIALGWARLTGDRTKPQQFAVRGVERIGVPDLLVEDLHLDVARVPRRTVKAVEAHVGP